MEFDTKISNIPNWCHDYLCWMQNSFDIVNMADHRSVSGWTSDLDSTLSPWAELPAACSRSELSWSQEVALTRVDRQLELQQKNRHTRCTGRPRRNDQTTAWAEKKIFIAITLDTKKTPELTIDDDTSGSFAQQIVDVRLIVWTVDAWLHGCAEYTTDRTGTKLGRKLRYKTRIENRTTLTASVHVDTHYTQQLQLLPLHKTFNFKKSFTVLTY